MNINYDIASLAKRSNDISQEHGFWKDFDTFPDRMRNAGFTDEEINAFKEYHIGTKIALIGTEVSEIMEARRKGKLMSRVRMGNFNIMTSPSDELFEKNPGAWKEIFEKHIKDTDADEMADTAIRLIELAYKLRIDLGWHINQKMRYNSLREHMHGKKY